MIRAIIFDADGVVISGGERFSERLAREHGIALETTASFFKNEFQQCLIGKADLREALTKHIFDWGWSGSVDELLEYWFLGESNVDERIVAAIKQLRLKGARCFLGTNQEKYRTEYFKKQIGFDEIFDGIFSSAYIGAKKPSVEFFTHILRTLQPMRTEEIFFWDDTPENVEAALHFDFQAALYETYEDFEGCLNNKNLLE